MEQEGDTSSASSSSVDWWEEILDRRALRGRLPPNSSPGRPPAALATPKTQPSPAQAQPVSQRGGKLRHGIVDRWHYPNGSIRVRQRERLAAEAAASSLATTGAMDRQQGDQAVTSSPSVPCSSQFRDRSGYFLRSPAEEWVLPRGHKHCSWGHGASFQ